MKDIFQRKSRRSVGLGNHYIFHLDDVSLKYGSYTALDGITLTVNPGDMMFVTGKAGAGKTSLLNILSQKVKAQKGRFHTSQSRDLFVARVPQNLELLENKTCEQNLWVAYDRKIYKNKNEFYSDLIELANILGIKDRLGIKMSQANGGLRHKTALIRALLTRPRVLLADEPTASLDKESAHKIFDLLNFYNLKRNLTVVWATHNRELVKNFPGKIVHLENSKLVYSGHACFI